MRRVFLFFTTLCVTLSALAQFAGGKGTADDPYLIADAYQLADIKNYPSSYYKMTNDIDLTEWIEDNAPVLGWKPISGFSGGFDGNNHTISGLYINRPEESYVGLFLSGGKFIKDLNVEATSVIGKYDSSFLCYEAEENCMIENCNVNGELLKGSSCGGICAQSGGTISRCVVNCKKIEATSRAGGICGTGSNVLYCTSNIKNIEGGLVGGICGFFRDIQNCIVIAGLMKGHGTGAHVGGVAGYTWSSHCNINNNFVFVQDILSDDVAGGIVGGADKDYLCRVYINNSYVYAKINAKGFLGGIIGSSFGGAGTTNCMTDGNLISTSKVGGIIGDCDSGNDYPQYCMSLNNEIRSTESVANGLGGYTRNSVALSSLISGKNNAYKVSSVWTSHYSHGCLARTATRVIIDGQEVETVDNDYNGTSYGDKTLKRASTYVGLGWDMVNTWKINEGEDYPYLRMLSDYPTITRYETTNNCKLIGTSPVNGKIYVMKNGATYTSDIVDNAFDINVGAVNVGDTLLYFSMPEGGKPSMVRKLILTEGTTDPSGDVIKGDANGDSVVDAADVVSIVNSILGKPSSTFVIKNADINEDGQILVDDAVGTVNIIMNAQ